MKPVKEKLEIKIDFMASEGHESAAERNNRMLTESWSGEKREVISIQYCYDELALTTH